MLSTNARIIETVLFIENEALDEEKLQEMTGLDLNDAKQMFHVAVSLKLME